MLSLGLGVVACEKPRGHMLASSSIAANTGAATVGDATRFLDRTGNPEAVPLLSSFKPKPTNMPRSVLKHAQR